MRLARTLFTLLFCVIATVRASSVRALRQHVAPRAQVDTCASIPLIPPAELPAGGGLQPMCLCLSGIPDAISSNPDLVQLVQYLGAAEATITLTSVVDYYGDVCTYPPGTTPVCSQSDPCGFQCLAPYVQQGSQCVCAAPYTSCNGVCDLFPNVRALRSCAAM
ncbi:hypothetical protein FA95DRAFT_297128 [Auriscalpium vulgare]|uniref:Uncharacterized protein n=1 Tax=Auriscalpium vulgare TaxID=40419 RepID=A0ACB8RJR3_9AGAM|nr:hypothetical protein FA95DRAFT_297128 [Auriscalpium vulgare]